MRSIISNPERAFVGILFIATALVLSAAEKPEGRRAAAVFRTEVPVEPLNVVLGRPTASSITLSVIFQAQTRAVITCEPEATGAANTLPPRTFPAGEPIEVLVSGLRPGTRHRYRIEPVGTPAAEAITGTFTTARPPGEAFVFTIQADSHLDGGTDPDLYRRSLALVPAARADFHIDLGDTFMTDKRPDFHDSLPQYLAQRHYLGLLGRTTPVFLVLGNHDGEDPSRGGDSEASMSVWANATRKHFFPNPEPDTFYTGNTTPHPIAGPLQNYYAWTWGDALFVVLDPFWFTRSRTREGDNWPRTLGREQYDWLERTLAASHARHKFIFIHHLVGGEGKDGRGGAEASRFFEWGGLNPDGTDAFATRRPEWPGPIHAMLVAHGVSAVFHGHDHLFVKQERDGIIYQEVPQPGHPRAEARSAAEYGYRSGVILPGAGILRVRVAPGKAIVEFLRVDRDEPAYSYELPTTAKN
jgi:predicted phosphodiesterase